MTFNIASFSDNPLTKKSALIDAASSILVEGNSKADQEFNELLGEFAEWDKTSGIVLSESALASRNEHVLSLKLQKRLFEQRHGKNWKNIVYASATKRALEEQDTGGTNGVPEVKGRVVSTELQKAGEGISPPSSFMSTSQKFGPNNNGKETDVQPKVKPGPFSDAEENFGHGKKLSFTIPGQEGAIVTKVDGGSLKEEIDLSEAELEEMFGKGSLEKIKDYHSKKAMNSVSKYVKDGVTSDNKKNMSNNNYHSMSQHASAFNRSHNLINKRDGIKEAAEGGSNGDNATRAKAVSTEMSTIALDKAPPSSQTGKSEPWGVNKGNKPGSPGKDEQKTVHNAPGIYKETIDLDEETLTELFGKGALNTIRNHHVDRVHKAIEANPSVKGSQLKHITSRIDKAEALTNKKNGIKEDVSLARQLIESTLHVKKNS